MRMGGRRKWLLTLSSSREKGKKGFGYFNQKIKEKEKREEIKLGMFHVMVFRIILALIIPLNLLVLKY